MIVPNIERLLSRLRSKTTLAAALLGSLFVHSTAHAVPIGNFSWDVPQQCDLFCGPIFSVGNFSDFSLGALAGPFLGVVVNLETDVGPIDVPLGDIGVGTSIQTEETVFFDFGVASAGLTLTFTVPSLPGLVRLLDGTDSVVTALMAPGTLTIDYLADVVAPVQVSEPPAIFLLAAGLIVAAARRRIARIARSRNETTA